jgi:hypothetical protein
MQKARGWRAAFLLRSSCNRGGVTWEKCNRAPVTLNAHFLDLGKRKLAGVQGPEDQAGEFYGVVDCRDDLGMFLIGRVGRGRPAQLC